MNLFYVTIIAFVLAMDAFAASISCGMAGSLNRSRLAVKVGLIFGSFQMMLFVMGWLFALISKELVSSIGNWVAFILLMLIGGRMIIEAIRNWKTERGCKAVRKRELVVLGFATSIDAFVIGLSLGVLGSELLAPTLIIGGVTLIMSLIGVEIGDRMRNHLDRWAEIVAGAILIGIAVRAMLGEFH